MEKEILKLKEIVKNQKNELFINTKKLQQMRVDFRVNKIYNILLLLKKGIENDKYFRVSRFIAEHKQESNIISAFNKIGLYEYDGRSKKQIFKWTSGKPSKEDAKFIIEFLNLKAKERKMLS
jgi:hypothetical protein